MEKKTLNVLLICAAGMSSSMLVRSMEKAAESLGIDAKVKAIPVELFMNERGRLGEYSFVLLAPQVRHYKGAVQDALKEHPEIKMSVIEPLAFGLVQGDKIMGEIVKTLATSK